MSALTETEIELAFADYRAAYEASNGKRAPRLAFRKGFVELRGRHVSRMTFRELRQSTKRLNRRGPLSIPARWLRDTGVHAGA